MTLMAVVLATAAAAQTPGYGVQINADESSADTDDTGCATFNATIRNSGSAPAPPQQEISLEATTEDEGWTIEPAPPASVQLGPGDEEPISFGACAGGGVEEGTSAMITLTATNEGDPGAEKASTSADFTATFRLGGNETDDGGLFDGNDTDEEVDGNETGDTGDAPGPGIVLVGAAVATTLAILRRRD